MASQPRTRAPVTPRRTLLIVACAALAISLVAAAGPAAAKKMTGTKKSEKLVGTKRADKIKGKGGNDRIKGKGGNDKANGGKGGDRVNGGPGGDRTIGAGGRDTLVGGSAADALTAGAGDDTLNAADNERDTVIDGGTGTNACFIDTTLELSVVRNCSTIIAGAPGGAGGGGGGGGGGGPGPGPGQGLQVLTASGLTGCASPLPLCPFQISGNGADAPLGLASGGGGVTLAVGAGVSVAGDSWTALGLYGCTADGFIRVTIGSESVDVPVDCAA